MIRRGSACRKSCVRLKLNTSDQIHTDPASTSVFFIGDVVVKRFNIGSPPATSWFIIREFLFIPATPILGIMHLAALRKAPATSGSQMGLGRNI